MATLVLAACGGDDGETAPTTTAPAGTGTTATTTPRPFPDGLEARLADELGDAALAADLVADLTPDALTQLEGAVGDEVASSPVLAYRPATVPADEVDSLVVFAFGNREAPDGTLTPGPVNEALAEATAAFVAEHPVPVYAQWEVADLLVEAGVPDVTAIEPEVGPDGEVVYLSTVGVAEAAVGLATDNDADLGQVGVVAFADHAGRSVLSAESAGLAGAAVPEGLDLPADYDPASGQPWTRDRATYLATDLQGRLVLVSGAG